MWVTLLPPPPAPCPTRMSRVPFWAAGANVKESGPALDRKLLLLFLLACVSVFGQMLILASLYQLPEVGALSL